ncbi:MAG: GAF domain-containing protein [Vicinamibacterales bacterium]
MALQPGTRLGPADLSRSVDGLLQLAGALGAATSLADIHEAALDAVQHALDIDRAAILLLDADGVMRCTASRGLSEGVRAAVEAHVPWTPGDLAPRPVLVSDVHADGAFQDDSAIFDRERVGALAFVPLMSRRVVGAFVLCGSEPRVMPPDEVNLALTIGRQVGFAVERTRTEIEHTANHQRLLFAMDAAQMGTWEWDLRTQHVRWSGNLERIHGLPSDAFDGRFESYEREIHPDDRERVLQSVQRALTEGAMHDVEYRIVAPDGTVRWMHGKGRVERDGHGQPVKMTGVCMDISLRKHAELEIETALRQEAAVRDRLTVLAIGSQQLLTTLDLQSVINQTLSLARQVLVADACAVWRPCDGVWRVAASEGLSETFTAIPVKAGPRISFDQPIVAEDVMQTSMLQIRRAAYTSEGIHSLVSIPLVVRGDHAGSLVFYHRRAHRPSEVELQVAIALGQLAAAAVSNAELYAEQQNLRAAAQQSAARAAFLAEASVCLSSLDYEANLRRVTEIAVSRLSDWCAVDLLDEPGAIRRIAVAHIDPPKAGHVRDYHARYPPDLAQERGVGRVIRTGVPELYADTPDPLLVAAAPDDEHLCMLRALEAQSVIIVPLSAGARTFGAMTFASTSPRRRYRQEDLDFAVELGRRAAYAVENARLYKEAQIYATENARLYQDAQEANRLKDEFLATLSHELRTPLNVMLGRARMLQKAATTESMQAALNAIERNGAALTRLVEDLLDLSRITLGRLRLESAPVNMPDVIDAAVQGILPAATARSVALHVDANWSVPPITGDATRLQQVVWNLLVNAVKFTPQGGQVTLSLTAEPSDLVLRVSDTGSGIDPAFLPHVFEMFRQAQPAAERSHGGLGVGLSIVRRLVELHGGTVAVQSAGLGQGAAFTVRLPRWPAPSHPSRAADDEQQAAV